jgi:hypothetical protein
MRREAFLSGYQTAAVIFLNTVLLFLPLYGIYRGAEWFFSPPSLEVTGAKQFRLEGNTITRKYGVNPAPAYSDLSPAEVDELLQDTWRNRDLIFAPFVTFQERKYASRFVNVNEFGIRHTAEGLPWPPGPGPNIFVFGGSTVFGYGVADCHTIPAQLGKLTGHNVYNLGAAFYYSSQERALFETWLARGIIPDQAIFLDGFNDLCGGEDLPAFTERFSKLISDQVPGKVLNDRPSWERAVDLYLRNKRLIESAAKAFGVKVWFIWQPTRAYKFDRNQDFFAEVKFRYRPQAEQGYRSMETLYREGKLGDNFLWLTDLHNHVKWPYIDEVHYSPEMCRMMALEIAKRLGEKTIEQQ